MTDAAAGGVLADLLRSRLRAAADPERAPAQQAYMKSAMPFLGVTLPETRAIARTTTRELTDAATLRDLVEHLWDAASHREERYAALAVLASPHLRRDPHLPGLIERFVRTGQWWDYTDELSHRVAELLDDDPLPAAALVRAWAGDDDMWLRRSAIIAQLGRRARTDVGLLEDVIAANTDDTEFFVRKAIGWALRDYARTDPAWVRAFVDAHELSPLSRREALKHLGG
ncbi:DNA alkylation repair protein [Microbacterium sp. 1P10UB]|uniref:DNA alkylation repair protein n=1 Tax=unclassified Microbacterium TaxID=2609290 RepID=UPI0039A23D0A